MNWEVRTMLLTRSFYNPALLRSDLRRCWPLLGGYTLLWLLILPLHLWRRLADEAPEFYQSTIQRILQGAVSASVWINLFAGIVLAASLFFYLSNARATCGLHSFPMSRGCQFRTHVLCGAGGVALGNVLVFLLAVLAQSGSGVQWGGSLSWLAASLLTFLLFFALGILCCVLTGWIPAVLVAFGGLNCVALLARLLINALCSIFYPSYNDNIFYMGLNDTATWLTPVLRLKMSCSEVALYKESDNFMSPDAWKTLLVYGLVAVALLVGSYFLYRIRRSERSGDTLAFKPLQPVVRWVVALLGGAGLGLVFAELFSGTRELPVLLSCMVGLGLVCMIGSQMLIAKTPRIFKKLWPELIALCVVIVGITLCIKADVFGYESRIPSVEQVVDAKVNMNLNYKSGPCVTRDPEEIAAVIEAHKYFQQREREEGENAAGYGRPITLTYFLESSTLSRRYDLRQEDVKHILPMLETESFRRSLVMLTSENPSVSDFRTGYYNLWGETQQELTAQQSQALYEAITDDAAHMDMTAIDLYQGEQCKVDIYLQNLDGSVYAELYLNTHCTRTLQLLQEWGIIESPEDIFLAYNEDYDAQMLN